jgi:hypothetical protein
MYGRAWVKSAGGTISFAGQDANGEWLIQSWEPEHEGEIARGADAIGDISSISAHGETLRTTATILALAKTGPSNTLANARAILAMPPLGTQMNVQGDNFLVSDKGLWNYVGGGRPQRFGEYVKCTLRLERYFNSATGTYVSLAPIA